MLTTDINSDFKRFEFNLVEINKFYMFLKEDLDSDTCNILHKAFQHKGFIVGGSAKILGYHMLCGNMPADSMGNYLENMFDKYNSRGRRNGGKSGDIDIAFESKELFDVFENEIKDMPSVHFIKSSKYAKTYTVNNRIEIQFLLVNINEPIQDQIKMFDIQNAMVAISDKQMIAVSNWLDLELKKKIQIQHINDVTFFRVVKWFEKHKYESITKSTIDMLYQHIIEKINEIVVKTNLTVDKLYTPGIYIRKDEFDNLPFLEQQGITFSKLVTFARKYLKHFDNEQLLMLSTQWPSNITDYGSLSPIGTLIKRNN